MKLKELFENEGVVATSASAIATAPSTLFTKPIKRKIKRERKKDKL